MSVPQLAEVGQDSASAEVLGHHAGAGSQAGPDVRLHIKTRLHRLLRQQTCQSSQGQILKKKNIP